MSFESGTNHENGHHLLKNVLLTGALFFALGGFSSCNKANTNNSTNYTEEGIEQQEENERDRILNSFKIKEDGKIIFGDSIEVDLNGRVYGQGGDHLYISNILYGYVGNKLDSYKNIYIINEKYNYNNNQSVYDRGKNYFIKIEENNGTPTITQLIINEDKNGEIVIESGDEYYYHNHCRKNKKENEIEKWQKIQEKRENKYFRQPTSETSICNPKNDTVSYTRPSKQYNGYDSLTYYNWNNWEDNIIGENEQQ